MDRNTVIGMILLGILFFLFFWYTNKQQQAIALQKQRNDDSTRRANESKIKTLDTIAVYQDSLKRDSISRVSAAGGFVKAANGTEQLTVVENDILKATFTNKGGNLKSVELKEYNSLDSGHHVVLSGGKEDKLGYTVNTAPNQSAETSSLFFGDAQVNKNTDGSQTVTYTLSDAGGESITHQYIIRPHNYMIDWNIILNGADKLLTQNSLNLHWNVQIQQQQISHVYEAQQSNLSYHNEDGYDYNTAYSGVNRTFDKPLDWFAFKQQFFNTALVSKG
ncbi:MAG TPA: membrane protein insertase YidC, partial [Chitinophagaceae bacterium]